MKISVRRITYWAMMLALFCVLGMFSINFGENVKVSLQLFVVFLIGLTAPSFIDAGSICLAYLLLGLFLPIYAGFSSGVSPTFGFVIGFVPGSIIISLIKKLFYKNENQGIRILGIIVSCLVATIVIYIFGASFMYIYFSSVINKPKTISTVLALCITPYIPFDLAKIALASGIYIALEKPLSHLLNSQNKYN